MELRDQKKDMPYLSKLLNDLDLEEKRSFSSLNLSELATESFFVKLNKISSDKNFPHSQALEHVLSIYRSLPVRFIYYITSDGDELSFYLGVRPKENKVVDLSTYEHMLESAIKGNFRGTIFAPSSNGKTSDYCISGGQLSQKLMDSAVIFSTVLGVPTLADKAEDAEFQSLDHILHCMHGRKFHILITWESISNKELQDIEQKVRVIFDTLTPYTSYSKNEGSSEYSTSKINQDEEIKSDENHSVTIGENYSCSNMQFINLQNAIDKELKDRINLGKAKGLYHTAIYLGATTEGDLSLLESSFTSVFQSNTPSLSPLYAKRLPKTSSTNALVAASGIYSKLDTEASWLALKSRSLINGQTSLATLLTLKELCIIAGFPRADVPGLEVSSCVSFGLNPPNEEGMTLGHIMQDGGNLSQKLKLPIEDLERHVFIAGTTGSGKTTTCHRLLSESNSPFLVIEPAKTEYRALLNSKGMDDLYIFTVGSESDVPFRINPFDFLPSENISSHIDMLKACFMSSFDMEAAMPNLLEEAMYRVYEQFGWSITTNQNRYLEKREDAWLQEIRGSFFPTIDGFIVVVEEVVKEKDFGTRLEKEYLGSLLARLDSLRSGIKGKVLNTRCSIDFNWLIKQKVVIELEELRSGEDKSFVMALIVTRLVEAMKAELKASSSQTYTQNTTFRHILLIEEAHRLLSSYTYGDSPSKKLGVEILTDMLAEMRKYHESLIIVDQIPSKLTPEVIKNTNTKIVHRLFAEDDKKTIANAIALSEEQKNFISKLNIGETIISGNGWNKPIHTKIIQVFDTNITVSDQIAFRNGRKFWSENPFLFCPYMPKKEELPTLDRLQQSQELASQVIRALDIITKSSVKTQTRKQRFNFEDWVDLIERINKEFGQWYYTFIRNIIRQYLLDRMILQENKFHNRKIGDLYNDANECAMQLMPKNEVLKSKKKFESSYKGALCCIIR